MGSLNVFIHFMISFVVQTLYKASNVKECYIIDAEVIAHDVPYHDYFYSQTRYMLTRVAKNKCRLRSVMTLYTLLSV